MFNASSKTSKRFLGLFFALLLSLALMPLSASASIPSGATGEKVTPILVGGQGDNFNQNGAGLFDGNNVDEWNSNKVFYWSGAGKYVEVTFPVKVNIYRSGTTTWVGDYGALIISKKENNGSYTNLTSYYPQNLSGVNQNQWEKWLSELPAGTYKFEYNGIKTRIDSEWYVESSEPVNNTPSTSTNVTWTNGSLTAIVNETPGNPSGFKANTGKSTGKWYWEVKIVNDSPIESFAMIGISGEGSDLKYWIDNTKYVYARGGYYVTVPTDVTSSNVKFGKGDVIGIALNLDNDTVIWFKNGVPFGENNIKPSTLPGSLVYPAVSSGTNDVTIVTGNFGDTPFSINPPSGYLPYNQTVPQTPVEEPETGRAILTVALTTGLEKEYDLSMTEVNSFISWYEGKAAGTGTASFAIDKHTNNKGPFKARKDYVIFDKILTFEINEYDVTE